MPLTEKQVKALKPGEKVSVFSDGNGLILEVHPTGRKTWIARLWIQGKEKRKTLGQFPDMPLRTARVQNILLREKPEEAREKEKLFGEVAEEWLSVRVANTVKDNHLRTIELRISKYIEPALFSTPINDVTAPQVLTLLRLVESSGFVETAHRVRNIISQIFRFGVACGYCSGDPAALLSAALKPSKSKPFPAVTTEPELKKLVSDILSYQQPMMRYALLFSLLTAGRPGEVRAAEWKEIDLEKKTWTIPAQKMKMGLEHTVPLSSQIVEVLEGLYLLTGNTRFLFPGARTNSRPMSDAGVRAALRYMGYRKEDFTPHGFRATFSTFANESGIFSPDVIEAALAHQDTNAIRRVYNRAAYWEERVKLAQWWGDYVFSLAGK
jgi:integrase